MIEKFNEITLQNLPSIIEQMEKESIKRKKSQLKEEKEIETRRVKAFSPNRHSHIF